MDGNTAHAAVLSEQRSFSDSDILIVFDRWLVQELTLTYEKANWIWDQISKFRVLFSDLTRGDSRNFQALLEDPFTYWLEIIDKDTKEITGLIYLTGMYEVVDAQVHILFFDRKPAEKLALCKMIAKFLFIHFPQLHRLTAAMPELHYNTIRLAKKIGFKDEGRRRQVRLIGGRWIDEVVLGLLASEALNGSDTE